MSSGSDRAFRDVSSTGSTSLASPTALASPTSPIQYGSRRARRAAEEAAQVAAARGGPLGAARASVVRLSGSAVTRRSLRPRVSLTVALVHASAVSAVQDVRDHWWGRRRLAVTSVAITTCLLVTEAAPQSAVAAPTVVVAPPPRSQDFHAVGTSPDALPRSDFTVVGRTTDGVVLTRLPGSAQAVARPVAGTIPSAGNFGGRNVAGCAACSTRHQGTDFAAATGTPVFAVMSGTVVSAGVLGGYGNQVLLRHPDGTETRYGHLSVIGVRPGQSVSVGERLGAVGSTGVSTGPHLHFEVILGHPVDPEPWLAARGLLR
ncbi:M23 family metallopeptidase [Curtobacterium sp. MCPF17_047]|uniref:M23 family metallopeptidase n=1 Tax=Curtobacterium sp. MCPF17_047 TaxID=2175654 RepID=UPI0028169E31|nr:M23 family metallopeptidase [Curtobacterium sp. MCPF17_047]